MKKHTIYKTVQLFIFIAAAAAVVALVFMNEELFHLAAQNTAARALCIALWAVLVLSFLFLLLDFVFFLPYRRDYNEMAYALYSDPRSGIANRFSCDMIVEKYLDKPLPKNIGSIMLELSNIRAINSLYGHHQGNNVISDFSGILFKASGGLCFVGRNGGNKFLAIFEDASRQSMQRFLDRVREEVNIYNESSNNIDIAYRCGQAFADDISGGDITSLIALSDSRIPRK